LHQELKRKNAAPDIMIATAARPISWDEMSEVLKYDAGTLRNALNKSVKTSLVRLDWIKPEEHLTQPHLTALVSRRRSYFERYAARNRPELHELFAA